ncbi:MAG: sulfotransferase [Acidobacteriota bacterium]
MAAHVPPWHERLTIARVARQAAHSAFFKMLRRALSSDDGRAILSEALVDRLTSPPAIAARTLSLDPPYADLGRASGPADHQVAPRPIFITARFRAGSTLLWNIFRHLDGCTAYYEPFNERRWFDATRRGSRLDETHGPVGDYWREYDGLADLALYYNEDWIRRRLYMDEHSWDPKMVAYVRTMIERAQGRAVLQFNRIDFRLAWFKRTFPNATVVHLFRHPRDQWCSTFPDLREYPYTASPGDFLAHDHYYLREWATDLEHWFPFLAERETSHPYQTFYYIWKLSYWFGVTHAHHSLSFEQLAANPPGELEQLFRVVGLANVDVSQSAALVTPPPSRWPRYADDGWFRQHEERCELILREFFGTTTAAGVDRDALGSTRAAVDAAPGH